MTTINEHFDQLLDQANVTEDEARSYAYNFQHAAVERIFESDSTETERCDLDERTRRELVEQSVDFLFSEDRDTYEILRGHRISAEDAGKAFTDIRSGHDGYLISEELTAAAKSYGDTGVH